MFKRGKPPAGVEVAWLLLGDGDGVESVELGAYDGEQWCEQEDWRGESTRDPFTDYGQVVLGWQEFVIPDPLLEPEQANAVGH